jgi:hypothetical protein
MMSSTETALRKRDPVHVCASSIKCDSNGGVHGSKTIQNKHEADSITGTNKGSTTQALALCKKTFDRSEAGDNTAAATGWIAAIPIPALHSLSIPNDEARLFEAMLQTHVSRSHSISEATPVGLAIAGMPLIIALAGFTLAFVKFKISTGSRHAASSEGTWSKEQSQVRQAAT